MKRKCLSWLLVIVSVLCLFPNLSACKKSINPHTRYEINAEYVPQNGMLTGTVKVHFENVLDNALNVLKFQLYANAYRETAACSPIDTVYKNEAYYQGADYGETVISSVNGAKNWEVLGQDENILYAYLEQSLFPGDEVVLDVGFTVKIPRISHALGIGERSVNLAGFFPILCGLKEDGFYETLYYAVGDPFYLDTASYTFRLTTPKEYTVSASGAITSTSTLESKKEHTMSLTNARNFAIVLSEDYQISSEQVGSVTLLYYHFGDKNAPKICALMQELLDYFQTKFGTYPYTTFSVAQTSVCGQSTDFPALVMLNVQDSPLTQIRTIARGFATQWWHAVVGNDSIENAWQGVGLSAYTALTFFESYEKYTVTRETEIATALKEYRSYYDVYGSVLGRADTRMTRHLQEFINGYEYQCLEIDKALVMFDTLRKAIGDDTFFSALKKYYARNAFVRVGVGELVSAFERTGVDVHGFFDSFLSGKAIL